MTDELSTTENATCEAHGAYEQRVMPSPIDGGRPFRSRCPECVAIDRAAAETKERREREAARERQVRELLAASGIPLRFRDRTFAGYKAETRGQKIARQVCSQYATTFKENRASGSSLVLTGGPGTGKTHLACSVARAVIEAELVTAQFVTVSEMMRSIKETYRKDAQATESDVIESLVWCDLLIIDEIGVQVGSDHEKLLLFEVLNGRYQELRPTILLSNLSAEDLETYLGNRVMDRYRECGTVLAFDWQSYRGRAAA